MRGLSSFCWMFHVKHEGWEATAEALGVLLPKDAPARMSQYERLLVQRGAPMGLIAPRDVPRVRERHIIDCLRGAALVGMERSTAYDLGSGGGLPGLVLAIARPDLAITLVEVRRHRAAFLQTAIDELGLSCAVVYGRRVETLRTRVQTCFARAFAPVSATWETAFPLLEPQGRVVYWAGRTFQPERDLPAGVRASVHRTDLLPGAGALVELTAVPA